MPTYEYICGKCGHEFEAVQPISAQPLRTCPEDLCGRKKWGRGKVKRKISAGAGLLFKGSGFYITDYRSKNYAEAAKKEKDSVAPKTSGGGAKPAVKPETKAAKPPAKT